MFSSVNILFRRLSIIFRPWKYYERRADGAIKNKRCLAILGDSDAIIRNLNKTRRSMRVYYFFSRWVSPAKRISPSDAAIFHRRLFFLLCVGEKTSTWQVLSHGFPATAFCFYLSLSFASVSLFLLFHSHFFRARVCRCFSSRGTLSAVPRLTESGLHGAVAVTKLLLIAFIVPYWVLSTFTWDQQILRGFTGFYWVLLGFTGFYWVLLGFTGFYET